MVFLCNGLLDTSGLLKRTTGLADIVSFMVCRAEMRGRSRRLEPG